MITAICPACDSEFEVDKVSPHQTNYKCPHCGYYAAKEVESDD